MFRPMIIVVFVVVAPLFAAYGQQSTYPSISGEIPVQIENDWRYASQDRANQNNDLFTKIEPALTVRFSPSWSLYVHAVVETLETPEQFENRYFDDQGLFVADLYMEYASGSFGVKAGKLNVGFGVGWDITPGVFGTDFAKDGYETSERIGVVGGWTLKFESAGEHRVSAGSFFQDTTVLSQSTLRGRGDTRKRDGGVSNTEDFSSYILAIDGGKVSGLGELAYQAAYMHQAAGQGAASDENSVALAIYTIFAAGGGVTISPMVEYVNQQDVGGVAGEDREFLTLAGQAEWNGFNLAVAWTRRETDKAGDDNDRQIQVSVGYAFDFGLTFDVGWKIAEEANVETRTLGAIATYTIEF